MDIEKINTLKSKPEKTKTVPFFSLQYTYAKKKDIFIIITGIFTSLASGVIAIPLMALTFGGVISNLNIPGGSMLQAVEKMCLQYFFIGLAYFFSGFLMIWMWSLFGRRISRRIKKDYFKILMSQEQGFFEENDDILTYPTKIQAQLKKIESGLGEKVGNILMSISLTGSSFIVGFCISWKLSLVLLSFVPLVVLVVFFMVRNMRNSGAADSKAYANAGAVAEETINNIKTIASFANYDYEIDRYTTNTQLSLKEGMKFGIYNGMTMGSIYFLRFLSYTLAVWFGGRLISEKEYNFSTGHYFSVGDVFIVIFTIIFGSFAIGFAIPNVTAIAQAMSEASDLFELRKRKPKMDLSKSTLKPEKGSFRGEINFNNVSFSYPKTPHIKLFDELNLNIQPYKITALVGPSGSGKTSIVSLLERLYDVEDGSIVIDSFNVKELDLNYYRSIIGYVPQEPVLFNQSIRENIIFGRENITNEMIWAALKMAYATEFVKTEEDLDFIVGMKGGKLSGGQKQRIAIARAILTQPKILILDEATSALDYESEKVVQKAMNTISRGITTIVVAHRLSTILNADKIIVLKNGKIVEEGNHTSLIELKGVYAELIKNQAGTVDFDEGELKDKPKELIQQKLIIKDDSMHIMETEKIPLQTKVDKTYKRKNSLELLQEKLSEETNKKKVIAELAGQKKKKLWPILLKNPWVIFGALFSSLCAGGCWPAYGILMAYAIGSLTYTDSFMVSSQSFLVAMYFIALACGAFISYFAQGYLFSSVGENLTYHLRNITFKKYLSLHLGFYDIPENKPNTLTTRLASETSQIKAIAFSMVGIYMQAISTLIIAFVLGFVFDWKLTLIYIAIMPILAFTSASGLKLQKGFSDVNEIVDQATGAIISESIINTKTIFCYNMQDVVVNLYAKEIKTGDKNSNKASIINGLTYGLSQLILYSTSALVFFSGASFVTSGQTNIQDMFRTIMILMFAGFGIGQSQQYMGDMAKSRAALVGIFSTIDEISLIDPLEIRDRINPPSLKPTIITGKIEFKNVTFTYPSKRENIVLKDINFTIYPGQKAAFVGYSGSGKSTIVQLIERFYDIDSGSILIDDVDIKDYDIISLRSFISIVMQEPVIFSRSYTENIRYGNLKASNDDVISAAEKANISEMIQPGHDTQIPSGGQKQRLAIARAIIKNPAILLLDEATSALDATNELEIQKTLDSLMEGRTTVTIAHKLSTVENSDVIFLMNKGEIAECGTHSELLQKKGKYFELYNYGKSTVNKFK